MGTRTLEYNTAAASALRGRPGQDGQDSRRAYDAGGSSRRQAAATLTRHSPGRWSQKGANAPLLSGWARGPNSRLIGGALQAEGISGVAGVPNSGARHRIQHGAWGKAPGTAGAGPSMLGVCRMARGQGPEHLQKAARWAINGGPVGPCESGTHEGRRGRSGDRRGGACNSGGRGQRGKAGQGHGRKRGWG
jgi:hypothetical protein